MGSVMVKDKHWRSAVKAASWRLVGTIDTIIISYFITHKWHLALAIGSVELFTKMILYYFHERAWDRVKIGRTFIDYEI